MSPIVSPPDASGGAVDERPVRVGLVEGHDGWRFTLTHRGETIALENAASLNRWAATGIVRRHSLSVSHDGIVIDSRPVRHGDANAIEELARIFNEHHVSSRPATRAVSHPATASPSTAASLSDQAHLAQSLKVTRDGFEFHVSYLTKFGEHKTERLEQALETLQTMRTFKPHVSLQKAGIRIVVTSWDGEHFLEQPGIENIEHSTPEQLEALIKRNLLGTSNESIPAAAMETASIHAPVMRIELKHKPHDPRLHLILHRKDGTTEEGPVFIHANLARLHTAEWLRPEIHLDITTMNDRLFIERTEVVNGASVRREEVFGLQTDEDLHRAEAALNACLARPER